MGIRGRVLVAIVLVAGIAMALMAWIVPQRLLNALDDVDRQRAADDATALVATVAETTSRLTALAATTSRTQEARQFLVGEADALPAQPDLDFLEGRLDVDGIALLGRDGTVRVALPPAFAGAAAAAATTPTTLRSGTVAHDDVWMVSVAPVTGPVGTVPAVGTVVYGLRLDEARLAQIGHLVESTPDLTTAAVSPTPRILDDHLTVGARLQALHGAPMALAVTRTRLAHGSGVVWAQWVRWTQVVVGLAAASGFLVWIDRRFVRRVARLRREVDRVGDDAAGRVTVGGDDEVAAVGAAINEMLGRVAMTQAELAQRNDELDEANRATDRFVATISHELRTPLTAILGFAATLQDRWDDLPAQQRGPMLERIRVHARILDGLVADLLAMQAAQATEFASVWTPLDDAVGHIVADLPHVVGHGVTVRLGAPGVEVGIAEEPLRRVVTNLVTNADKYGAPPITVTTTMANDGAARIEVTDRGTGVPLEFVDHLFEPFRQAATSNRRQASGVGLGLSIVAEILSSVGGQISHQPAEGGGASFLVHLDARSIRSEPHGSAGSIRRQAR